MTLSPSSNKIYERAGPSFSHNATPCTRASPCSIWHRPSRTRSSDGRLHLYRHRPPTSNLHELRSHRNHRPACGTCLGSCNCPSLFKRLKPSLRLILRPHAHINGHLNRLTYRNFPIEPPRTLPLFLSSIYLSVFAPKTFKK